MAQFYCYVEDLGLTAAQRNTLIAQLQALGANGHPQPSHRNHWRVRSDSLAVIFHAEFGDADLTADAVRNRLAAIFGVSQASITYTTAQQTFAVRQSPVVTYKYNTANKLRLGVFGGLGATNEQSRVEVLAFLAANAPAWEG